MVLADVHVLTYHAFIAANDHYAHILSFPPAKVFHRPPTKPVFAFDLS